MCTCKMTHVGETTHVGAALRVLVVVFFTRHGMLNAGKEKRIYPPEILVSLSDLPGQQKKTEPIQKGLVLTKNNTTKVPLTYIYIYIIYIMYIYISYI